MSLKSEQEFRDLFKYSNQINVGFSYGQICFPLCVHCLKDITHDCWWKYGPIAGQNMWFCEDCNQKYMQLAEDKEFAPILKEILANQTAKFRKRVNKYHQWMVLN